MTEVAGRLYATIVCNAIALLCYLIASICHLALMILPREQEDTTPMNAIKPNLSGFSPGPPKHVSAVSIAIDREVAAGAECDVCGRLGMRLHAYHRGNVYKAIARCPNCNHATEF